MNPQILQNLKNKLQTRYQNVLYSDHNNLINNLKKFWEILQNDKVFVSILQELEATISQEFKNLVIKDLVIKDSNQQLDKYDIDFLFNYKNEKDQIQTSLVILKHCQEKSYFLEQNIWIRSETIGFLKKIYVIKRDIREYIKKFNNEFISPLYYYIVEKLDDNTVSLGIFQKYKQKCEWFLAECLQEKMEIHTKAKQSESKLNSKKPQLEIETKVLAPHLYEYLHDQGLEIFKEVQIDNGRCDFRGLGFIGEVKIFGESSHISRFN